MDKYYINSISIEGFRGINNQGNPLIIQFQPNGVTSFFGENGMGKSSIYEAFLFSLLGRIIRFDDYHRDITDKRTTKNLFHVGDGNINIEFIDDSKRKTDINIKIGTNAERTINSTTITNPEVFLTNLCSNLNFIDYKSFEKILLKSSEETGKLFSNLVGFEKFNNIKDKFDKISRTQNINNDFGKSIKEETIHINSQKIIELKSVILLKLKEIGIEINVYY
jgi:recombinational DNA repair ATPase RecF